MDKMADYTDHLTTALQQEIARVRDVVMPPYVKLGPEGFLPLTIMRVALHKARKAMADGDAGGMIAALEKLKGYRI